MTSMVERKQGHDALIERTRMATSSEMSRIRARELDELL